MLLPFPSSSRVVAESHVTQYVTHYVGVVRKFNKVLEAAIICGDSKRAGQSTQPCGTPVVTSVDEV